MLFSGGNMKTLLSAALLAVCVVPAAQAQMVESHVTASNGVVVDVNSDDFAGRAEYTSPSIKFKAAEGSGSGSVLVAKIKKASALGPLIVDGFIVYSGDWQYFESAVYRGGDPVDFKRTGGEVGSCRYGCTLTESFRMNITPADVKKHAEGGVVIVQIRATKNGNTALISIPASYLDAVQEVAK